MDALVVHMVEQVLRWAAVLDCGNTHSGTIVGEAMLSAQIRDR